ncbi:MAG: GTPase, partial [Candidatus Krumholzibacteriia bacterium]
MTERAPRGLRLHIGLFGRRNVGKSSLLNALAGQDVAIVSPQAGTTTDPVEKPFELLPLGPVVFIDTAGLDDEGALGALRLQRTRRVFDRTELAVIVAAEGCWEAFEAGLLAELTARGVPVIAAFNKGDLAARSQDVAA